MPAYAKKTEFMALVRKANPTYERILKSSLRPLIAVLDKSSGTAQAVKSEINKLPAAKVTRYLDPLYFLLASYPNMPSDAGSSLSLGSLGATNAALYKKTVRPGNFKPDGPQAQRVYTVPGSASSGLTTEQFILANHATTAVLMIHVSGVQGPMHDVYNGRSVLKHMESVLRVARARGCPCGVLTMESNSDVCVPLRPEWGKIPNSVRIYEPDGHVGTNHQSMRTFAASKTNLVVMGFDAGVCVFANVFGSDEKLKGGGFKPELITMANVVMSRATLVSSSKVWSMSASLGQAEFGPIFNT
jgi:hypothetical protein